MAIEIKERFSFKKKILISFSTLFGLFLIAGASFYFYKTIFKPDPISLLPKETAFYFRIKINPEDRQVKNLKEILNKFPYYQKISQKIGEEFERLKKENPPLKNLDFTISDELILAFISPIEEEMKELPLVLILPNPDLEKLEKLAKDVQKAIEESENWKLEEEAYKGRKIFKAIPVVKAPKWAPPGYKPPEPQVKPSSVFTNGHFFLATKPEDIKKIIDVAEDQEITKIFKKEKIKNITSKLVYRKIEKYLPKDYLLLFYGSFNYPEVLETLKEPEYFSPFVGSLKAALELPFFKPKEVVEPEEMAIAGAIIAEKNELKSVTYSLDLREDAFLPSSFSFENSLAKFVSEKIGNKEVFLYEEGRNLKSSFEEMEKTLKKRMDEKAKKEFEDFLKSLEEFLEVNLKEDILALFEKNYAFFFASESTGKETPTVAFIFEIEDENKVKENLLKIKLPKVPEFTSFDIFSLGRARKRAKDARIIANMHQLRTMAELIYDDQGSYENINCTYESIYGDIKMICQDIKDQVGFEPTIYQSKDKYCAFAKLNEPGAYYCIDSEWRAIKTYINPAKAGYCTGKTFVCPTILGEAPPETFPPVKPEKIGFTREIIKGFEIYSLPVFDNLGLNFSIKEKKLIFTFSKEGLVDVLKSLDQKKLKDSELFAQQFIEVPKNVTGISYTHPYGFLGLIKHLVNFSFKIISSFAPQEVPEAENVIPPIFEFLDKGIAPYLKVLKSFGSFAFTPKKGLTITKERLIIEELPAEEKRATEEFWEKFPEWIEDFESAFAPPVPEKVVRPEMPKLERREYELFLKEIAYRGTAMQNARLPIRYLIIPEKTKIQKIEAELEAFNRDPVYARSVGIAVGSQIPEDCRAKYYFVLGPEEIKRKSFILETDFFRTGVNLITAWVSTYGEWGGIESWVSLKLKIYYSGEEPKLLQGVSILEKPIDPISCKLK